MRVQVRLRGVEPTPPIIEYASRRAHQHLSRFGRQVSSVTIRIVDVNGPKGGADKRCQLTLSGPRLGTVSFSETNVDAYAGIDVALDRVAHAVGRLLERARGPRSTTEGRRST